MEQKGEGSLPLRQEYRGAVHQKCNLWYAIPYHILIVFHNLSGCDAHLLIRELGRKFNSGSIEVIAENKEGYISFNVNVAIGRYEMPSGEMKQIMRQL